MCPLLYLKGHLEIGEGPHVSSLYLQRPISRYIHILRVWVDVNFEGIQYINY